MRRLPVAALGAALLLIPAASASAIDYPAPAKPTVQPKPSGPFRTLTVGHHARYRTIQSAVNAARAGDTVKIRPGVYRESVMVRGAGKRYLKIVGDPAKPAAVTLEGKGLKGAAAQSGIMVNGADHVTLDGITAQNYKGNGVFVINVTGYTLTHLRVFLSGTYGIYAFNSRGGTMSHSEAAWNNDSGFYIGQTPPQSKPLRSLVTNVTSYGNVLGFSGTNMRYVTITKSRWFNNGTGIVPNALSTEKFAPPEHNEIIDNDVFWNNFNYYAGAPFKLMKGNIDATPYPVGVGVLLFGSRHTRIENNRIWGNYLAGAGMIQQLLLGHMPDAQNLVDNSITGNQFGLNGTDRNGRDLVYDGNGKGNCISGNTGVETTEPADASTYAPCPFTGDNAFSTDVQATIVDWALEPTHEKHWVKYPHASQKGIVPLERYSAYAGRKPAK